MVSTIASEHVWIWRAVDDEGEVMDMIVQKRRDAGAALRFLRRLLKNQKVEPETIVTDGLRSYRAALDRLGLVDRHRRSPRQGAGLAHLAEDRDLLAVVLADLDGDVRRGPVG